MPNIFGSLARKFRPHLIVDRLHNLDCAMLAERGLRGVLLDLDNTITPWRSQEIPVEVEAWIAQLHAAGLQACMVTNSVNKDRVRPVAERLGIPWVGSALKPLPKGFLRGMRLLDTTPDTTAMVGDLLTMDICGGNYLGLFTVLVEPMAAHEWWPTRFIQRPLENRIVRRYGVCEREVSYKL